MLLLNKIWRSNFFIKLRNWEYWPFMIIYWPVFIYWFWLSLRAKSLFYFSTANPGIENGGMLGESKIKILDLISYRYKPDTTLIDNTISGEQLKRIIESKHQYPIICKPDVGERGWKVEKIKNDSELMNYHRSMKAPYLVQEYLTEKLELGVFYYRYPYNDSGTISSMVIKEMLSIIGNGRATIKELILANDRAKLQWKILKLKYANELDRVLKNGEKKELVSIGNHSKGTTFLDGCHLITEQLCKVFDNISQQIDGFYFGRFDIKVNSLDDLYQGKIKIMELNGAGSEPAHIYNPGYSLLKAYQAIFHHWRVLFEISVINHNMGINYLSLSEAWQEYKKIKKLKK